MNNLIIIGNGFDLAHNLKTSYSNFYNHVLESHFQNRKIYSDLIFIEDKHRSLDEFMSLVRRGHSPLKQLIKNMFFYQLISKSSIGLWCDIEQEYFDTLLKCKIKKDVLILNKEFELIKKYLGLYLKSNCQVSNVIESYIYLFHKLVDKDSLILNFNYTNTLGHYSNTTIKRFFVNNLDPNIINIHGQIDDLKNPMIFGFAANDEESRSLINRGENEFVKNIKKHAYKITGNEGKLKNYLNRNLTPINVFILGHSCGISDKLILNQILNHSNIKTIRVFYHERYQHFFDMQVNMDRIMKMDENFSRLVNFESSIRMPQISDKEGQIKEFKEYVDNVLLFDKEPEKYFVF